MPEIAYSEVVKIAGQLGEVEEEAKADTGADRTSIDMEIAARVGAGPIVGTIVTRSAAGVRKRILARLGVRIREQTYSVDAAIDDRSAMKYAVLIGRDVLQKGNFSVVPG